jgi:hypothetical protein
MYTRKLLHAIQKLAVELGDLIAAAGRRVTIHRDDQDLVAVEACIESFEVKKTVQQQVGCSQEHHGQGDLRHNQNITQIAIVPRTGMMPSPEL